MKIRQGFVSNSSTTSFCIYGAALDHSELKAFKNVADDDEPFGSLEKKARAAGLNFICGYEENMIWIGRNPDTIKDDETGKQFKDSVKEKIDGILGKDVKCYYHTEEICS